MGPQTEFQARIEAYRSHQSSFHEMPARDICVVSPGCRGLSQSVWSAPVEFRFQRQDGCHGSILVQTDKQSQRHIRSDMLEEGVGCLGGGDGRVREDNLMEEVVWSSAVAKKHPSPREEADQASRPYPRSPSSTRSRQT
ncbi:MAG: hypothetical protein M1821_001510 [Bathelium mastoideum]|nr:MAG: hypothetical protein M1821_001510 [Bathelium mastoideum]KAI9690040.1 MAG: hypothetical protein M1822_009922 [Bathelium mastoideum]